MTKRLLVPLLAVLVLEACGHRGDPLPPLRRTPPAPTLFRLAQRGDRIELVAHAPKASVDGVAYKDVTLEFLHGSGEVDLTRAGVPVRAQVLPGAAGVRELALPSSGTLLRATVRAVAGGEEGPLALSKSLVVQAPLPAPSGLEATLLADGVALEWRGEIPKAVPPPPAPKSPKLLSSSLSSGPSAGPEAMARPGARGEPAAAPMPGPREPGGRATQEGEAPPAGTPAAPAAPPLSEPKPASDSGPDASTRKAERALRSNGFFVYRRTKAADFGPPLAAEPLDTRQFTDAAPLGTVSCYVVRSVGSTEPLIESAPSNEVCLERKDIQAPATPGGLAVLPRPTGLELVWSPTEADDLAGYRVYRESPGAPRALLAELQAASASFLDETAKAGVRYRYTVTSRDAAGNESAPGEPADASLP